MSDRQEKIDNVTVGQIRRRITKQLDDQINTLNGMIRLGYHNRPKAATYLDETIGQTLTQLQNLDAMASTEIIFPAKNE